MVQPAQVLSYLSHLAPTASNGRARQHWAAVTSDEDVVWESAPAMFGRFEITSETERAKLARLVSVDALQTERLLRVGWCWLTGKVKLVQEGVRSERATACCLPVFVRTVSFQSFGLDSKPVSHSDAALHPNFAAVPGFAELVEDYIDEFVVSDMPSDQALARLHQALSLVGVDHLNDVPTSLTLRPFRGRQSPTPLLWWGFGVYMDRHTKPPVVAQHLKRWSAVDVRRTAFAHLYGLAPKPAEAAAITERTSPLPLNAKQRAAIERLDKEAVVAIAGPPGTGKSHAAVALACEAIHRGQTVLIATKSDHAAQSICELLDRYETPAHVRFGTEEHRQQAIARLAVRPESDDKQRRAQLTAEAKKAQHELGRAQHNVRGTLQREERFRQALHWRTNNLGAAAAAPGVLDESADIAKAERLLTQVQSSGWLHRLFRSRREQVLRTLVRARESSTVDEIATAIGIGRADVDARDGLDNESVHLAGDWTRLEQAVTTSRSATAALLASEQAKLNWAERYRAGAGAAALSGVLRAGKERRTRMLSQGGGDNFLSYAPLWVGTLDEIESTLPAVAGLFDLVIFDEASQIDQLSATPALCRSKRVAVVGDPKQLRHVSFVADAAADAALDAEGLTGSTLAHLLDVRRNSLFDVAAAASATTQLDEHFRSVPHLIDFSNRRFYNNSLRLMTQHPRVEHVDGIWHGHVGGQRDKAGVVLAEVATIMSHLQHMIATGDHRSVGIVTPFRAQADALLEAAAHSLSWSDIRTLDLRIGTVHGMQGTERDLIMISLGLGDDDLGRSLRFVQDPHLFNVMITRARRQIAAYHSFDPANLPPGLLRDWFLIGDLPPGGVPGVKAQAPWTAQIASELAANDLRVIADYPVAGWTVDLAVGERDWAFGVETGVHPDGVDAHIERHLTLRRAGWHLVDAFESRWLLRSGDVVAQLATLAEQRRIAAGESTTG